MTKSVSLNKKKNQQIRLNQNVKPLLCERHVQSMKECWTGSPRLQSLHLGGGDKAWLDEEGRGQESLSRL